MSVPSRRATDDRLVAARPRPPVAAPVQGDVWETMLYLFGRDPGWPA